MVFVFGLEELHEFIHREVSIIQNGFQGSTVKFGMIRNAYLVSVAVSQDNMTADLVIREITHPRKCLDDFLS
jgi:hypothetical protein